jgi:hypothetical protein
MRINQITSFDMTVSLEVRLAHHRQFAERRNTEDEWSGVFQRMANAIPTNISLMLSPRYVFR